MFDVDDAAILDIDDDERPVASESADFISWRAQWVKTTLKNLEHLEIAHEVVAELGADSIRVEQFAGRAALILLELERRARGVLTFLSANSAARCLRSVLPIGFDGTAHRIMTVEDALRRGYWFGADASAAAAAAYFRSNTRGRALRLCTETIQGVAAYARARLVVDGRDVEPWPEAKWPEAHGCTLIDDVSALLGASLS